MILKPADLDVNIELIVNSRHFIELYNKIFLFVIN